jgi:hypothetical protein
MTWQKARAQSTQGWAGWLHSMAERPRCGANAQHVSCYVGKKVIRGGKVTVAMKLGCPTTLDGQPA